MSPLPHTNFTKHSYGPHDLQVYGVWERVDHKDSGYWIIFIHGGAWRDPTSTYANFEPSIKHMQERAGIKEAGVRGYISIDYRLSSPPGHAMDPSIPPQSQRTAKHPDHVTDVLNALHHMQEHLGLADDKYIISGHSAGATLAFQCFMGSASLEGQTPPDVPKPAAIIGLSGIYDLEEFADKNPGYDEYVIGPFGTDRDLWRRASPARFQGDFKDAFPVTRQVYLAWGPEDGAVKGEQLEAMTKRCHADKVNLSVHDDLKGVHDSIWKDGKQIADLVVTALKTAPQN